MKVKSLVIMDQHAMVTLYSGFVHTARHALEIGQIEDDKRRILLFINSLLLVWGQ
jgi:hypothetical protein